MSEGPSSLPEYPQTRRPDPPLPEDGSAVASPLALVAFFFINLVAAYAPAMCWVGFLPGTGSKGLIFLFSPVASLLTGSGGPWAAWILLAGFSAAVFLLSAMWYQSRVGRLVVPGCLFGFSLVQGLLFASFVAGIHALGRS